MGSANTSCGISGIDMGYNTEAGIVLLLPNENPDTYGTVNLDPTNYYKPFLPPIFGTYTDDAFTITQETPYHSIPRKPIPHPHQRHSQRPQPR